MNLIEYGTSLMISWYNHVRCYIDDEFKQKKTRLP